MRPIFVTIILVAALLAVSSYSINAQTPEQLYQKGLTKEEGEGALLDAISLYTQVADNSNASISLRAKALMHIGMCYEKLGTKEAVKAYQRLIANFPTQKNEVAYARERLAKLISTAEKASEISLTPKFTRIKIPTKISSALSLSPNGKNLGLISDSKIWVMPLQGNLGPDIPGQPVQVNTEGIDVEYTDLSWSGDGKWIAFNDPGMPGPNQSIYIVPSSGGKPKKIIENYRDARIVNYRISLSPDGKKLAFSSVEENKQHIFTISTEGGDPIQLTDIQAREPAFSPDGKMIAFVEDKNLGAGQGGLGLWIVPASDGTPNLVADAGTASSPVWSPDGNMIAFLDLSPGKFIGRQINIVPVSRDGKNAGKVTRINVPEGIEEVRMLAGWTPDNKLGTLCTTKQEFAIYTLPSNGGQTTMILHDCYALQPRWSPDGKQIVFTTPPLEGDNRFYRLFLASVPANGGKSTVLPRDQKGKPIRALSYQGGNRISPDGKWIVSATWTPSDTSSEAQFPRTKIWKIALDGSESKQITNTQGLYADLCPSWSPDGDKVAFVRVKLKGGMDPFGSEAGIYIINFSRGEPDLLTSLPGKYILSPVWSPDGKMIAYLTAEHGSRSNPTLNVINVNTRESRIVGKVPEAQVNVELAWSPDSRQIAFNGKTIHVMNIDDGSIKDIKTNLTDNVDIWHLDWSPDGKQFVFAGGTSSTYEFWFLEDFLPLEKLAKKNEKEDKEFKIRQIWADYELYSEGAPSPDGRYISYVHWDTGDLGILEIATGIKHRLTNKGTWDESDEFAEYSRWSPDGKQIVYDWYNEKGFIEIRIIGIDGSKPRILYRSEEMVWARTYGWSPDGKQILACFSRKDGEEQIVLVSVDDGSVRVLKILKKGWPKNMNFSPEGRYIVYDFLQKDNSSGRDISLLSTDGSREIILVEHPANDYVLGWAPNGENILIASDRTGTLSAWLIPVAEGKPLGTPKLVKPDIGQFSTMGFTREGSFYYHFGGEFTRDVYSAKLDPETGEILIQPNKAINSFEGNNLSPDYSPDGKYLAYIRRINGDVLCIHSLETGEEREFSLKLKQIELPRWSPDCSSILLAGKDDKNSWKLYQINSQTGDVKAFVSSQEDMGLVGCHEWSPDGKAIFYGRKSKTDKHTQIIFREIESGTEKELYLGDSNNPFYFSCSPDGRWLSFFNKTGNELKIMPTAGGESRGLFKCKQGDQLTTLSWTPDGKYILFVIRPLGNSIRQPEQNKCSFWRIPVEGGEPKKLGLEMSYAENISVHPDGQHITFYNIAAKIGEVWMMENFLPKEGIDNK